MAPESTPFLCLAMIGAMAITATALLRVWPNLLSSSTGANPKYVSIAGLRGLLASSVFVHHAQVSRIYFRDGAWMEPQSTIYAFAGTGSVGVFFMITGFLFWGKALDGRVQFLSLIESRARRILPLYMLSFLIITVVCAYDSNFSIATTWEDLYLSIFAWLGAGLFGHPAINGVGTLTINCGVTWTLQYEWIFYLLLPLIAALSSPQWFAILVSVFLITVLGLKKLGYQAEYQALVVSVPFIGGMLAAYAVRLRSGVKFLPSAFLVSVFVATSFVVAALAYKPGYYTLIGIALFPAFCAIALGNDVFGLLRQRWVRFLGEISFSVYLLHGIILMGALSAIGRFVSVGRISYFVFVLVCAALSATVVLTSTASFLLVERRYMKRRVSVLEVHAHSQTEG